MSDWTQEIQLQFLEAYQEEPVIWDPNHIHHKDKKKRIDAWTRIEYEMGKPIKELKAKKDSLMATYRGYCRKIAASSKSGASADDVYKPVWFAFEVMDQFLSPVYTCTVNTQDSIVFKFESSECEDSLDNNESSTSKRSKRRKTISRRAKQTKNVCDTLTKKSDVEDDCDVFGKLIAKKLKKLSENEKEDVMFEIEQIFHTKSMERRHR